MNYRFIIAQLGLLLLVVALAMLVITGWATLAWIGGDAASPGFEFGWGAGDPAEWQAVRAMVCAGAIGGALGAVLWIYGRKAQSKTIGRREALLLVASSWLIGTALGGLPYYFWALFAPAPVAHQFHSFASCYFESVSGFTTTGATVLNDIDALPRSILLWRATTHWLGGLGIVVLFVAVLPTLGVGGKKLFAVESSGPSAGVRPRIRETARVLWFIYLTLTVILTLTFWLLGMNWFDAVCHTFSTLATGGYSTHNASMGYYNPETVGAARSWAIQGVTVVFMMLAGVSFGLYYQVARRRFKRVYKDRELRFYFALLAVASVIVVTSLWMMPRGEEIITTANLEYEPTLGNSIRYGVFQAASFLTGTGYCTADYNFWPFIAQATLVCLMFIGGSAGSTAGGLKVIRVLIAFKVILAEIEHVFRPNVVRTVRVGSSVIDADMRQSVLVYIVIMVIFFAGGAVVIEAIEPVDSHVSFVTAATASAATLFNVGPGLELVGARENFGFFTPLSKLVMCLLMLLGRLEVYALAVLLTWRFWKRD